MLHKCLTEECFEFCKQIATIPPFASFSVLTVYFDASGNIVDAF